MAWNWWNLGMGERIYHLRWQEICQNLSLKSFIPTIKSVWTCCSRHGTVAIHVHIAKRKRSSTRLRNAGLMPVETADIKSIRPKGQLWKQVRHRSLNGFTQFTLSVYIKTPLVLRNFRGHWVLLIRLLGECCIKSGQK